MLLRDKLSLYFMTSHELQNRGKGVKRVGVRCLCLARRGVVWHTPSPLTHAPGPRATSLTEQGKYSRLICVSFVLISLIR